MKRLPMILLASLCLFLRGDLAPAAEKVAVALPACEVGVLKESASRVSAAWSWAAWNVRVGTGEKGLR